MTNDQSPIPMTAERWRQIKTVLGDALERPPVERAMFLDHVCRDDLTLRAEVESLMAYEQSGDNGKDSPAAYIQSRQAPLLSDLSQSGTANLESDESPDENRRIGPYKIVSELGRGGMGVVYMAARADDQYRHQVAIKLIRRGMDTDFVLRRFRNERQILAGLDHPNIAKLLDGGATEDGLPYLVMEYVAGIPIDDYCDQHALDTQQRLRLFQQVCGAIHYAHQRQVIHRDIKPSNILVGEASGLKLLDFGIAKLLTPELAAQTLDPTAPALRLMTPAYASPEQVKGEPVTTTTDVYSLGVLLYELLTGHKPYRVKSHAPHEISQAVLEEEPLKPSTAITLTEETVSGDGSTAATLTPESVSKTREGTPDRLRRRLRGDLDSIVLSALRKDPRRRYASVEQFSEDIRRHLEGLPVIARKDTLGYRTAKLIRRNRVGVAAVTLSTVLLAPIVLLTNLWTSSNSKPKRGVETQSVAVLPFKTIGAEPGDEYLGLGISDAITSTLTKIKQLTVRPIRTSLTYASTNQDPIETGQALRVDAILEGTIGKVGDGLRMTAQLVRVDDGSKLWEMKSSDGFQNLMVVQEAISEQVARALGVKLTDQEMSSLAKLHTESLEAYHLYLKGRYLSNQRAWKERKEGIECFEKAINIDQNFAQAYADLAFSQISLTNPLPTMEKMPRAKEVAVKALEIDDTLAEAHTALGRAKTFCDWDWAGAEREFKRAIELSPNYAEARTWYSDNLSATGRHDAAISEVERAQGIDPFSPRYHLRLGWAYYFARQYDQAIEEFRKTPVDLDESNFQVYQVYWRLGLVYLQKSMYEEGISMIKKAESLSGKLPLTRASLAYAYAKSGNHGEARKILDEFKGISKQVPFLNLAAAYACLSDKDTAFEWLERAYQHRDNRIIHIKVEPMLDSMRSDPRFEDLLRRIGLAP